MDDSDKAIELALRQPLDAALQLDLHWSILLLLLPVIAMPIIMLLLLLLMLACVLVLRLMQLYIGNVIV